jgi:exopolysaccharide biosynthesis polyprenyl glycosylphosphotransferase
VLLHFAIDAILFASAFLVGISIRFADEWNLLLSGTEFYWPAITLGAVVFPCICYTCGLYSPSGGSQHVFKRALILALCLGLAMGFMVTGFYIKFSSRIGRGAMLISGFIAYFTLLAHHCLLLRWLLTYRERVAFVVSSAFDEMEIQLNQGLWSRRLVLVGLVRDEGFQPSGSLPLLGDVGKLPEIVQRENIARVLCTNKNIRDPGLYREFCALRYSGVTVMPLIHLCEEVHQNVPLELVTPEWLLNASGLPHMLYIKKLKRGFDIVSSLVGLVCLSPVLLVAIVAVRTSSRGPIFYKQVRAGRFGREFSMIKLRTMRVDAEKDGAVWAAAADPRTTAVGAFLRKYRIDEIPQLVNVLLGQMSLVGPRPERPEFIGELANVIPYFRERLMVQPGITGWAQVNYPYGASADDTRRKLEYDLYYMKHMSVFLDLFILLDTVRIVLLGGLGEEHKHSSPRYETSMLRREGVAPGPISPVAGLPFHQ